VTTPEDVRRLAEERARRRSALDFAAADALRDRIREAGWEVVDRPEGFELRRIEATGQTIVRAAEVPSALAEPPSADWSLHWLHEGWPEDVERGIASFDRHAGGRDLHHVVVEAVPAPPGTWPEPVEVLRLSEHPGFGAARNAGLIRSRGRLVAIVDGSLEATGDALAPLEESLADPSVGVAGPIGVVTPDLREFREAVGPEVDAIEGYLMTLRRELLDRVGFDRRYRFYRAADVDLSFQVKALGLRAVRVDVPIRRHTHRAWEAASPGDRDRLSKRNLYRFLDRFRGRTDLLAGRAD
jgi:glycosyltransferase involved in cell wall biosynthesis